MEASDNALLEKLLPTNDDLRKLWDEHLELERQLEVFNRKPRLTAEDEMEEKRLKKIKLAGRDRIEAILDAHR